MTSGTWRRPMGSRDTGESHRAATPLELHTHLADLGAAAAFTIPVVLYVLAVAFLITALSSHPQKPGTIMAPSTRRPPSVPLRPRPS